MNPPDPATEIHELCDRLLEGNFTSADRLRLESLVCGDPALRQLYVELMHEHAATRENASQVREHSPTALPPIATEPMVRHSGWSMRRLPWLSLAASLAIVGAGWWLTTERANGALATLVETTEARWGSSSLPTAPGSALRAGQLRLEGGMARIVFQSGAEVRLEGPADLQLSGRNACFLHSGVLTAHVPEKARGFSVGTTNARLIDHGTDFGMSAQANGPAQVRVLKGEVELQHGRTGQSLRLNTRESARITPERFLGIHASDGEPAVYSFPQRDDPTSVSDNSIVLSSAAGRGEAVYVVSPNSTRNHSNTLLLIKNHSVDAKHQRKACVRFDLAPLGDRRVTDATLTLNFEATGLGYVSLTDACTFAVYGLIDDAQDNWSSRTINWETCPAYSPDPGRVDLSRAAKLGTFVLPRGVASGAYGISGDALAGFLNADANRQATLIVVRETVQPAETSVHGFAGNRHPTLAPPTLRISLAPAVSTSR